LKVRADEDVKTAREDLGSVLILACEKEGLRPQRLLVRTAAETHEAERARFDVSPLAAAREPLRVAEGAYVLYWMLHNRRSQDNAALAVAMLAAQGTGLPLLVVESLTSNYPWLSQRQHCFVAEGVAERARVQKGYVFVGIGAAHSAAERVDWKGLPTDVPERAFDVSYLNDARVGRSRPANAGVIPALLADAAVVVSDWAPWFIFPGLVARVESSLRHRGGQNSAPFILVDDCGLVPGAMHPKVEAAARFLRPKLVRYKEEAAHENRALSGIAERFALSGRFVQGLELTSLLERAQARMPGADVDADFVFGSALARGENKPGADSIADDFPLALCAFAGVDDTVKRAVLHPGGEGAARARLDHFLRNKSARYDDDRNHPDLAGTSGLSPYLHYGMIHPRTVVREVLLSERISTVDGLTPDGGAAKFLDELVTWRELGLNMAHYAYIGGKTLGSIDLVPGWALKTLREHMGKAEANVPLKDLERAASPDPIWNAAQKELTSTGTLHNYMRMIWGKGIVRWSSGPEEALERMEYLNNKYALDGRDPNSYTGLYWTLGKFDRPWPPARPPFGIVRSLSTKNARKKLSMENYLERWR